MYPEKAKKLKRCKRGHWLRGENIYLQCESRITKRFGRRVYFLRSCMKCRRIWSRNWRLRQKEQS